MPNILTNAYFSALAMGFTEHDRLCVPVPFYHCFGMVLANLLCLSVGACIVLPSEHFDALAVLSAIKQERCTGLHGMPTMFIRELEHPGFAGFNLSSLRKGIMAGAPCPAALIKRVINEMGCRDILIGYGETEASPITHLTSREDSIEQRIATVGRNLPHQEVKVIDPSTGGKCTGQLYSETGRAPHDKIGPMTPAEQIASQLNIKASQVTAVIGLLDDGNLTVPFIARYRKEMTGSLDDEQIRTIADELVRLRGLEERRASILASIEEQGKLTDELRGQIDAAATLSALEDLYAPYKKKRRTRAMIARENGLEPLADLIQEQSPSGTPEQIPGNSSTNR